MRHLASLLVLALACPARAESRDRVDPLRILPAGKRPDDRRLRKPKDLNGYFPMTVPASRQAWEKRKAELREQALVGLGLWPMPPRLPVHAVVHGKIDRDDYTIEKVYFASHPGHYVCGNLYRPKSGSGKHPGVLCPHGHWSDGRFNDQLAANGQGFIDQELNSGAERTLAGARYPLQARCVQLARMGCVVLHYDMVGYADSRQIEHRVGFTDAEAELWLQSFMGLQTFNSIRALDFLLSLPDVDAKRIGVTGASGGGTQTFILCAVDDRPTVAFAAVMVSTAMQGGCVCENCSYLRQETGNVELAALFAPKPLGMSGAHDWTIDIETKGLPELKKLYELYGVPQNVMAKCFPQFQHNYNRVSRELMESWFNEHLELGQPTPITERDFVPVPPSRLSVFDSGHPLPKDAVGAKELRGYLTRVAEEQLQKVRPTDEAKLREFRRLVGTALRVMIHDRLPRSEEIEVKTIGETKLEGHRVVKLLLGRSGADEQVPAVLVAPAESLDRITVWIDPHGKAGLLDGGRLIDPVKRLLEQHTAVLAPDVFMTGEFGSATPIVDPKFAGFTLGYNRPLVAERVHDILTAIAYARTRGQRVSLVGVERAGPWTLFARALSGDAVQRAAIDFNQFDFHRVYSTDDDMMLPGALKYGGIGSFAALVAPHEMYLHNVPDRADQRVKEAYATYGEPGNLELRRKKAPVNDISTWLLR